MRLAYVMLYRPNIWVYLESVSLYLYISKNLFFYRY